MINDSNLRNQLPSLLSKYFITSNKNSDELNRFYYLLSELYFDDKELLNSIKLCFTKNNDNLKQASFKDRCNIFESYLSKCDTVYLRLRMSYDSFIIGSYGAELSQFGDEYNNINNNLSDMYDYIKNFKINNSEDVLEYLYLIHTYYEFEILFNNLKRSFVSYDKNVTLDTLSRIQELSLYVFNRLIQVGFLTSTNIEDIPYINCKSFDELRNSYSKTHDIDLDDDILEILLNIRNTESSDKILNILKNVSNDKAKYILYLVELELLESIVSMMQTKETEEQHLPLINSTINRIIQIKNIRKNIYIHKYVKQLKTVS